MGVNKIMNVARRLDEREYRSSTSRSRRIDLRVVENDYDQRYENNSRSYTTVHYRSNSRTLISQVVITMIVLFMFVSCIGFLAIQAQIASVERDISLLSREITELNNQNNMKQSIITTATNIETVRENASLLGMSKPGANQVKYLSVNNGSTIVLSAVTQGN